MQDTGRIELLDDRRSLQALPGRQGIAVIDGATYEVARLVEIHWPHPRHGRRGVCPRRWTQARSRHVPDGGHPECNHLGGLIGRGEAIRMLCSRWNASTVERSCPSRKPFAGAGIVSSKLWPEYRISR